MKHEGSTLAALIALLLLGNPANAAATQLLLSRGGAIPQLEYKGVVDLTVSPGFDSAKVAITVDGQKIADNLRSPYRVVVDFGPSAVEHKIAITAQGAGGRKAHWIETINRGHLPLAVKVKPVDLATRTFEIVATAPGDDPIEAVQLWDDGKVFATTTESPWRVQVPEASMAMGFVQVTAKSKSGEEVADFWSSAGEVHSDNIQVRTVPIFVSVVDANGITRDDVDRSLFRILDNAAEAKIVEFGKAFDQPISIALLLDASSSMIEAMPKVAKAANEFVQKTLRTGDRCSVTAIQDVPRRRQTLTDDTSAVQRAVNDLQPRGQTALYDSVASAIRELKDEKRRRAIVLLTDGADTSSIASSEEIDEMLRESGIPLYVIAYETGTTGVDLDRMKYLSAQTGGFVAVATQQNLMAKYGEIEKDLRAQFAITYQVTDYSKPNEWRRVRVQLNSPKLTARTIGGYFTP